MSECDASLVSNLGEFDRFYRLDGSVGGIWRTKFNSNVKWRAVIENVVTLWSKTIKPGE